MGCASVKASFLNCSRRNMALTEQACILVRRDRNPRGTPRTVRAEYVCVGIRVLRSALVRYKSLEGRAQGFDIKQQ
jgi:hypothetical protein